jgi:perosamine synthetase
MREGYGNVKNVLDSGYLTEEPVTREFDNMVEDYLKCNHVLAVTSCTTGLGLALRCLGVGLGDEVEEAITDKTKIIMRVSGFGNPLDYDRLNVIKQKYNLFIVEDAACSLGAEYKGV